jgi:hypothetical protein
MNETKAAVLLGRPSRKAWQNTRTLAPQSPPCGTRQEVRIAWAALLTAAACSGQTDDRPELSRTSAPSGTGPTVAALSAATPASSASADLATKELTRGRTLTQSKQWARAAEAFRAAAAADPDLVAAYAELGWALYQAGDLKGSRAASDAALSRPLEPRVRAQVLYNLGRVQEDDGERDLAKKSYEESIELRKNDEVKRRLEALGDPSKSAAAARCDRAFTTLRDACACLTDERSALGLSGATTCERAAPAEGIASGGEVVLLEAKDGKLYYALVEVVGHLRPAGVVVRGAAEIVRITEVAKKGAHGVAAVFKPAGGDGKTMRLECTVPDEGKASCGEAVEAP